MFTKRNFVIFLGALVAVVIGTLVISAFTLSRSKVGRIVDVLTITKKEEPKYFSKLDGAPVASEADESPMVIGVMIDNHTDARPQSGLNEARVVYEVPVEGEFTRYFAVFNASNTTTEVGPVRSARPYFLDWSREYGNIPYMHSGGSPEALSLIETLGIFDVNEFYWGRYYWRNQAKDAPHNVYTNSVRWQEFLAKEGSKHAIKSWSGWSFYKDAFFPATSSVSVQSITITYLPHYVVSWKYSANLDLYERFLNGMPYVDANGKQVFAKNILIQEVPTRIVDEYGRKDINTVGTGNARVLTHGTMVRGTWSKNGNVRTRFYSVIGDEVLLQPGNTWVQIVPQNTNIQVES